MLANPQPRFKPETSQGIIAQMGKVLDAHSDFIENIKVEGDLVLYKNAQGGITIEYSGGGATVAQTSFGFSISAVENDGDFSTTILGGTAQALGDAPHVYGDQSLGVLDDGDLVWLEYNLNTYSWAATVKAGATLPTTAGIYCVVLGAIGAQYINNVRQDRIGAVEVVVTKNSVD